MQAYSRPRSVAVMQPYFFPYAAYFSLLAHVDEFVIFDCVQFRRRGRIHRTEVPGADGSLRWLTLPIAHSPRETLIRDIEFSPDARGTFDERLASLPWLKSGASPAARALGDHLARPLDSFNAFLEEGLRLTANVLDINVTITRSSALKISPDLHGPERVLAVAKALGSSRYVNLPGGRDLYDPAMFAAEGMELAFLPDYRGPHQSMLHALMTQDIDAIRSDVLGLKPEPALIKS